MGITIVECRRMISREILLGFLIVVFVISVYESHKNLDRYHVRDAQGISVTWKDNLSEAKKESAGLFLDKECMKNLQEDEITMLPFGFDGADQPIQSSAGMFYSLYNITYLQQFLWNLFRGYVVLLFMVSLALAVTICTRNILASAAGIVIFIALLVIFNQVYFYPVNHWFANFMPVRMTEFRQSYLENEWYRIFGVSISAMSWSMIVSLMLAAGFLMAGLLMLRIYKRKNICENK